MSQVIVRRVGEDGGGLAAAVREIMDRFEVPVEGRSVLVKPNLLGPFPAEEHVTTSPLMVRTVVDELRRRGAGEIMVGDNPGGFDAGSDSIKAARRSGLFEAADGCFRAMGESALQRETGLDFAPAILVSRLWLEADVVVNLPVFKTHLLTGFSGAIKNLYGIIPGAQKAKLHLAARTPENFNRLLAAIYAVRVPDLNIMDGIWGMEGNGPSHGRVRNLGIALGAADGVALDAVAAAMMGFDPARMPLFGFCRELGLGDPGPEGLDVDGDASPIPDFKPPTTFPVSAREQGMILHQLSCCVPELEAEACMGCARCADNCPALALVMESDLPVMDRDKCISCFCCVELCPEGAMRVPDSQALWNRMFTGQES